MFESDGTDAPKVRRHTRHIQSIGPLSDGQIWVRDDRFNDNQPFPVGDELHLAAYIHQHSTDADYYPLGDVVHKALERVGFVKPCLPCAERQARMNRWLRRRGG